MIKSLTFAVLLCAALTECPDDPYCIKCNLDNTCAMCANSYLDNKGICVQGDISLKNCFSLATSNTCNICNPGYFLSNGKCVSIKIKNCIETDPNDERNCILCMQKKSPKLGKCAGKSCKDSGCRYCDTAQRCGQCHNSYSLTETLSCVKAVVTNCFQYEDSRCIRCNRGFYMSDGKCLVSKVQGSIRRFGVLLAMFAVLAILI